jgi:seryl-tRNA synthetase
MLDIRWIRDNPQALDAALTKRGWMPDSELLSKLREGWPDDVRVIEETPEPDEKRRLLRELLLQVDFERRELIKHAEAAQQAKNQISKQIGKAKAAGDTAEVQRLMAEVAEYKKLEEQPAQLQQRLDNALAYVPNIPLDEVPVGADEHANAEYRRWGNKPEIAKAKEHFEIGEALGGMDFETASKLSGSRFVVLKGQIARLERALGQFMLDLHTTEQGYTEVQPPLLVKDDALFGTAQLPKFGDDQFYALSSLISEELQQQVDELEALMAKENTTHRSLVASVGKTIEILSEKLPPSGVGEAKSKLLQAFNDLVNLHVNEISKAHKSLAELVIPLANKRWLIPTAEVPLTNLVRESILSEDELPIRVAALTPCFRSEAGAAGKDTRGMLRQHQFDKVELVSITTPEQSRDEHERMLTCAEEVLKRLDIHYRVMTLSTGDMGFAAQKTYDIEVWLPGQGAYREISSCSVCGDFQARRMNARYKPKDAKGNRFVHTLNGSGVAVGRALIAVLENYQNEDGSVTVPDVLRPYMGGLEKIGP